MIIPSIATGDPLAWPVCIFVCMSVTLVHPAKTNGRNEMPPGKDIGVIPSNVVLYRGPSPPKARGD